MHSACTPRTGVAGLLNRRSSLASAVVLFTKAFAPFRHDDMRHLPCTRLGLVSCLLISLAAVAAPSTEAPSASDLRKEAPAPLPVTGGRAGAQDSDSRTIEMLVEMQQPTAGVQFNERASRGGSASAGVRPTQSPPGLPQGLPRPPLVDALQTPPSGLFGSAATPAVQSRTPSVTSSPAREGLSSPDAGRPSSAMPTELQRWLHWPREAIEYVRENRTFVLGCTALLLLMGWAGSVMFNRSRG